MKTALSFFPESVGKRLAGPMATAASQRDRLPPPRVRLCRSADGTLTIDDAAGLHSFPIQAGKSHARKAGVANPWGSRQTQLFVGEAAAILLAADWEKAFAFYAGLFGWQKVESNVERIDGIPLFVEEMTKVVLEAEAKAKPGAPSRRFRLQPWRSLQACMRR